MDDAIGRGETQLVESCRGFSLDEIITATDNFDDALVVGSGGFGKVYKGFIDNGTKIVAIKRLNDGSKQGAQEFWTEVKMLSKLQHAHLVALIGYCSDKQEMILVYEYIARGTLASHLYKFSREESDNTISHLTWEHRLKICVGAARGLDYLHSHNKPGIIHRDVKSTNILLDEDWVAKVSDFGLCRGITKHTTTTHVITKVKGTFGYLDPNYFFTNRLTKKSDVYAFGVVLFEVLSGRPPVDTRLEEEQISLVLWAKQCIEKGKLDRIIDPSMTSQITSKSLKQFVELANKCLGNQPNERPTMAEVVEGLEIALASHERKGRTLGMIITKAFQGIRLVPKGMNHWWREGKENSSMGAPTNSVSKPLSDNVTRSYRVFSLDEIRSATNNFDNGLLINTDEWFILYKGYMDGGTLGVLIKRFPLFQKSTMALNFTEVVSAEVQVQSLIRHPNIVSLLGFCNDEHDLFLVYEYMGKGTLSSHLYNTENDPLLWRKRLEICIDIARGIAYLHAGAELQVVINCSVKTTNILLDNKWDAKVTDLSMSKIFSQYMAHERLETVECTTFGYLDPEYFIYGRVTKKCVLYAFGVVLLEILCARNPSCQGLSKFGILSHWFIDSIKRVTLDDVIDPYLIGKISPDCLRYYVRTALSCLVINGIQGPSMTHVLVSLESALQMQKAWENLVENGNGDAILISNPSSYNIFSLDSEFTIDGESFSNLFSSLSGSSSTYETESE